MFVLDMICVAGWYEQVNQHTNCTCAVPRAQQNNIYRIIYLSYLQVQIPE